MKKFFILVCSLALSVAFLTGCASPAAPVSTRAATPVVTLAAQVSPSQPISPEDTAWAKVVQAAKKEGTVNVYSYNMIGETATAVIYNFEKKYGVKIEIISGGGATLAERINTEKRSGTVVADVMDANTFQIGNIKISGATASSADIPVLSETKDWVIEPWANDPQRHILIHSLMYTSNIINTNLVKPNDEPRSLKDVAQARWKGRMVYFNPRISSGPSIYFLTMLKRQLIDQETVREIGKGIDFTSTDDEASKLLIQGKYAMRPAAPTTVASRYMVESPDLHLKAVNIEEGTVVRGNAMSAIVNAPHPNAARLLINWLLSQEGQTVFVKPQGLTPVRKDVPDFVPKALQFTPTRIVVPTIEEEAENTRLFREGWLAKLWGR